MNINSSKGAFSVEEFLHWASIGRTKFYDEVKSGRLKLRKIGRKSVITISDAHDWLDNLPEAIQ